MTGLVLRRADLLAIDRFRAYDLAEELMNRSFWLPLVIGVVCGGAIIFGVNHIRSRSAEELFAQKIRCKELADKYQKERNSDEPSRFYTTVDRVDYSTSRHSCVVAIRTFGAPSQTVSGGTSYRVEDLLSHETLFNDYCTESEKNGLYCGNGRNLQIEEKQNAVFQHEIRRPLL